MTLSGAARRLMIIVDEDARFNHQPLYREIVRRARDTGLAGASVFRGIEGFGPSHLLHTARILDLTDQLPVMIVIIDTPDRVEGFLPALADLMVGGVIALDDVDIPALSESSC